ncbi:MetQ/NlpA family ABC transporter substrate-binding protein [Vaginisenegalia massiliensis]|uniref:MetQ/NlpA family ABC transporter substrate-binding protein n=1 Tax=Vaginisenegalia massiliensis TaxID=2058294 RepID=UPI000F535496|nr:MetQ/NlpA family ABC transporter substrate-binding protein [Vaginisenegalia massiliensis]
MTKHFVKTLLATTLLTAGLVKAPHSVQAVDKPFDGQTVKIGVVSDAEEEVWDFVAKKAEKEAGIRLDIVLFTDYVQPNVALQDGSLDINAFQHIAYLEDWNKANKGTLEPLGFTYVTPLGIYSEKVKSLDELAKGARIAIPNDPTNGGRALLALEQAGVIEVDDKAGILPTVKDVTKNPKQVKFEELDAAQIPNSLSDVDAAAINNTFAIDNGLTLKDAIFIDAKDLKSLPDEYKNVVAVNKSNKDRKVLEKVLSIYQTEAVKKKLLEVSKGSDLAAWE